MVKKQNKKEDAQSASKPPRKRKSLQKKLIDMQMTDGKVYNKKGVRNIDELLGISSTKYNTTNERKYEDYLDHLNTSDLQAHATTVGVLPNQDRSILVKRLLKEFRMHNSGFLNTAQNVNPFPKKIRQETLDILAQGK